MYHVVLFEPEIPPNTGNIIRLCANCGAQLHLIRPLGFEMSDKQLRRAGLDYHEFAKVQIHDDLDSFLQAAHPGRLFACSTRGGQDYTGIQYQQGDALLFGPETRGLPQAVLESLPEKQRLRIPMVPNNRSLNLANAVAIIVFEAWRQQGFSGAE
ncbi:tRNA (uridine(34)/cytosine(34)/5-carboxymethylaminomethyluridine(34)-2'-O)-methyltransferase TrmL [Kaarinaea lacus]